MAPNSWDDVWLNEGHATWYEWTLAAERGELGEDIGIADLTGLDAYWAVDPVQSAAARALVAPALLSRFGAI